MAFNGRTILPFKVGAFEILSAGEADDSVSSLVVDLRHQEVAVIEDGLWGGRCCCEVEGSDCCTSILDGVKAKAVTTVEWTAE